MSSVRVLALRFVPSQQPLDFQQTLQQSCRREVRLDLRGTIQKPALPVTSTGSVS